MFRNKPCLKNDVYDFKNFQFAENSLNLLKL